MIAKNREYYDEFLSLLLNYLSKLKCLSIKFVVIFYFTFQTLHFPLILNGNV